ncbi:hypothetical protein ES288_A12G051300v1 [Gossypium darwinii]|uniref:Uncharacterized protein n=1 Tax=Gossypium darwinii TaxID=34276 RepID=A0A5D2E5T7_GOSDA|nr:hypothetical protein ES288_A12G051300v1 [Gossypium darwinii]
MKAKIFEPRKPENEGISTRFGFGSDDGGNNRRCDPGVRVQVEQVEVWVVTDFGG